ncbi:hypothetical protein TPASS_0583 [Treponema pallidum subsp. pallidum SS14]|uniref:Uncharacterized protein n=1 Tax=Treponema pallidum subsp. pallidum (strain SS14) TaxID=455434 RepID=A0A0H3BJH4_TREPS|nr:hypothetical protein TPASS_0583 [Treponema pallidum subsp. pallidum SS14]
MRSSIAPTAPAECSSKRWYPSVCEPDVRNQKNWGHPITPCA